MVAEATLSPGCAILTPGNHWASSPKCSRHSATRSSPETRVRGAFASGNFPSGHVVYITSLCGLLGWFALARGHHATCAAMLLLILGMGPLRVIDGAHWPSDVLAGYALGLAWTIAVLVVGLPWAAGQKQTEDHPAQPATEASI